MTACNVSKVFSLCVHRLARYKPGPPLLKWDLTGCVYMMVIKWCYGCFFGSEMWWWPAVSTVSGGEEIHPPLGILINAERMKKDKKRWTCLWNNDTLMLFQREWRLSGFKSGLHRVLIITLSHQCDVCRHSFAFTGENDSASLCNNVRFVSLAVSRHFEDFQRKYWVSWLTSLRR